MMTAMTEPVPTELPRKLGLMDAALLLVGAVIGSGIFVVPSLIARQIPEPGLVIAIWLFSGLLVLCGALTLAELGAMLPQSGELYVYIRESGAYPKEGNSSPFLENRHIGCGHPK